MATINSYLYGVSAKITRTVSSNNLIVSVKNFDDTNFSAGSPLIHKINNYPRALTGALSVTVNAGASTFDLGAAEHKTLRRDLFVYLGWRVSTASVFILLARIPYARTYNDFSLVATEAKYGAYSGAAPASTDPVEVIGRVSVQNSGSASYNWSVPTEDIIISHPIYETDWTAWTPTPGGFSVNPTIVANYKIVMDKLHWILHSSGAGTSNATTTTITLPLATANVTNLNTFCVGRGQDNGAECAPTFRANVNSATMDVFKGPGTTVWTNSGSKFMSGEGFYRIN